eukprot:1150451-Pelagomonas_calceolata.AAC.1
MMLRRPSRAWTISQTRVRGGKLREMGTMTAQTSVSWNWGRQMMRWVRWVHNLLPVQGKRSRISEPDLGWED